MVAICDLNNDGLNDLILTGSNFVSVLLQESASPETFLDGPRYPKGQRASHVVVSDINGDSQPDIVVANAGDSSDGSNSSVSILEQDTSSAGFLSFLIRRVDADYCRKVCYRELQHYPTRKTKRGEGAEFSHGTATHYHALKRKS